MARRAKSTPHWPQLSLLLLLGLLCAGKLAELGPVQQLRNFAFDQMQRLQPRAVVETPLLTVAIDDESLSRGGQWPWPRALLAQLIETAAAKGAAVVVLDLLLAEPERTADSGTASAGDTRLAKALRTVPTVVGFAATDEPRGVMPEPAAPLNISGPAPDRFLRTYRGGIPALPQLAGAAAGSGSLNGLTEIDGVERRAPLFSKIGNHVYPSLLAESLRVALDDRSYRVKTAGGSGEASFGAQTGIVAMRVGNGANTLTLPTSGDGSLVLHLAPSLGAPVLPAWRLLDGSVAEEQIAGRMLLIGVTAAGIGELRPTALGPMPGIELVAQAIEQSLTGMHVFRPDWADGAELAVLALFGLLLIWSLARLGAFAGAALALAMMTILGLAAWFGFERAAMQLDPVFPGAALLLVYIAGTALRLLVSDAERVFVRRAFAQYLSPELVAQLSAHPEQLKLGGERRELTLLFTDIANFTTLSEQVGPVALAPVLNEYFDGLCSIVLRHGGMVNEFIGDAVLAFFGAPLDQPDHAARAVACAAELDEFSESFRKQGRPGELGWGNTRVGLHTGTALVGNFGSRQRFKYAALGDVVNTASRIEGLNKFFRTRVCLSGDTAGAAGATGLRPLGRVQLKGKSEILEIFELPPRDASRDFLGRYCAAFGVIGDRAAALPQFEALHRENPLDGPTDLHLARLLAGSSGDLVVMAEK